MRGEGRGEGEEARAWGGMEVERRAGKQAGITSVVGGLSVFRCTAVGASEEGEVRVWKALSASGEGGGSSWAGHRRQNASESDMSAPFRSLRPTKAPGHRRRPSQHPSERLGGLSRR